MSLLTDTYKLEQASEIESLKGKFSGGDGYTRMDQRKSFESVGGWGRDGWNLGNWPYVVISHRDNELNSLGETFDLLYDVEGDATIWRYPTRRMRGEATDELALFHWRGDAYAPRGGDLPEKVEDLPPELRGPYRAKDVSLDEVYGPRPIAALKDELEVQDGS